MANRSLQEDAAVTPGMFGVCAADAWFTVRQRADGPACIDVQFARGRLPYARLSCVVWEIAAPLVAAHTNAVLRAVSLPAGAWAVASDDGWAETRLSWAIGADLVLLAWAIGPTPQLARVPAVVASWAAMPRTVRAWWFATIAATPQQWGDTPIGWRRALAIGLGAVTD